MKEVEWEVGVAFAVIDQKLFRLDIQKVRSPAAFWYWWSNWINRHGTKTTVKTDTKNTKSTYTAHKSGVNNYTALKGGELGTLQLV